MKSKQTRKLQNGRTSGVPPKHLKPEPEPEPAAPEVEAGPAQMTSRVVEVTPAMAKKLLEKNHPENRPIAWSRVQAMANDMRNNSWKLTHQAICVGEGGMLIDGQHRLQAVVMADCPATMLVIRHAEGHYNDPIDRGGTRRLGVIMGLANRDTAALTVLRMFEQGYSNVAQMTLAEAEGVLERHRDDFDAFVRMPSRGKLFGAVAGACIWATPVDSRKVAEFVHKVATGEMIGRGDAAWALRSWLARNVRANSWDKAMATFNCLRFYLNAMQIGGVYTGEMGYRAITTRRRVLKIPHTPGSEVVPASGWKPARGKADEGAEVGEVDDVFDE